MSTPLLAMLPGKVLPLLFAAAAARDLGAASVGFVTGASLRLRPSRPSLGVIE
jgi:hypothetical protein